MHESLMALAVVVLGVVVLGVSWLIYLGNGGTPFNVTFRGLGISVDIFRQGGVAPIPSQSEEASNEREAY